MAQKIYPPLSSNTLEGICDIIAETNQGLSATELHRLLLQSSIEDNEFENGIMLAKRKKLFNAFAAFENKYHCSNNILTFIQTVLHPSRYIENEELFSHRLTKINQILAFEGYQFSENGKLHNTEKASVIADVKIKTENLKQELETRRAHNQIFNYCKEELLQNNYFHSVLEANKGLFQRIRDLSFVQEDGNKLIEQVFSTNPILIINNYQTPSEKNEHNGFCNLLKGLCSMFRNPTAHEPKVDWEIDEQDALEILGIISYCHRRLDKAQRIR